ncbi:MAG TPA: phosphohydrolase [Albitalea sp.]|uniref:HD domain-containing protein n=1 Tax=Piscinibacter sp. TaxID=1903157 RepID=UPI002ED54842
MDLVDRIHALFDEHGGRSYEGGRREPVTALQHALQCAQRAESAQAEPPLVAAALLHDLGHFLDASVELDDVDDVHELRALPLLAEGFGADVIEPIRLHVQAKRYLVATDPAYAQTLSPASVHSLGLQGGRMNLAEADAFARLPCARDAVALRRWDDLAKDPTRRTPPLEHYLALLRKLSS